MSTEAPKRSSRKGRPNNPIEFRRRLAALACQPGVSVARLALEHGLNTNLLFKWRRAYLAGEYDRHALLPVAVVAEEQPPARVVPVNPTSGDAQAESAGVIEISIGVARVRIEGTPNATTLRLVLQSLRMAMECAT